MDRLETPEKLLFIKFAQKQLNNAFEIPTGLNEIEWLRELKSRIDSCDDEKVKSLYLFHALYDFELNSQISKFGMQKFREYKNRSTSETNNFQHYAALFFEAFIPAFLLEFIDILKLPKYYRHLTRFCLVTNELFENEIVRLTDVKYHEMMLVMMIRFNIEIEQALEEGSIIVKTPCSIDAAPVYHFNSREVSNFYSCLHAQYKLVATILHCFIRLPNIEMSDTFKSITYVENVILKLDHHQVPLGCLVEGSIILSRIVYMDSLRAKSPQRMVDFLRSMLDTLPQSHLHIPILSAFLNDLPFHFTRYKFSNHDMTLLNNLIIQYKDSWGNKSDTRCLYLLGNLYAIWSNVILKFAVTGQLRHPSYTNDIFTVTTHNIVRDIIRFTYVHFGSYTVPQIHEAFKGGMRVLLHSLSRDKMQDYVEEIRKKCDCFVTLDNPQIVHRVFLIMYEIMDKEAFICCFGRVILTQSISTYLESFILDSDAAHLDFAMSFHDEFEESDRLNETLMNLYQATNRNNDLVAILNLRLKLFGEASEQQFFEEMEKLVIQTDSISELSRKFFFNKILPKLIILFKKDKNKKESGCDAGKLLGRILQRIVQKYLPDKSRPISVRTFMSILRIAPKFEQFGVVIFDGSIVDCNRRIQNVALNHFDIDVKFDILDMFLNDYPAALKTFNGFWKIISGVSVGVESLSDLDHYLSLLNKYMAFITSPKRSPESTLNFDNVENFFKYICDLPKDDEDSIPILMHLKTIATFLPFLEQSDEFPEMAPCLEFLKKCLPSVEGFLKHSHEDVRNQSKNIILYAIKMDWIKRKEVHRQRKKWETASWEGLSIIHPAQANYSRIQMRLFIETQRPFENREEAFLELLNNKLIPECDRRVKLIQKKETNTLEHPTFAVMCVIRTIVLEDLANKIPTLNEKLINRLISLAIAAGKAVLPVVVDDSPEGHLPEEERESGKTEDELYLASQKYLLNSWVTIRESVLLMVGLADKYPSPSENPQRNISCNQAQEIMNYMFHNQINLVHRGAFELSSNALLQFIQVFDRKHSSCESCDDKLMNLTENVFRRLIKTTSDDRIENITRRSAGFPGFIQAIYSVLPHVGNDMMSNLLTLIESESVPKEHWQVVHTFNIFRTLIQDSKLNDHMSKMMERILVLCLKWFNYDPSWIVDGKKHLFPIRNACSILFSALMTKIFGVKRNKQDTSPKNRMLSQLFFHTYPSVYSLLLEILSAPGSKTFLNPALYILSRITPSKVSNDTFDMTDFLEPLKRVVMNINDYTVRKFAAQVYAQFMTTEYYRVLVQTLSDTSPKNKTNFPSLLLMNEILPAYGRHQQATNFPETSKSRIRLFQSMFKQGFEQWKDSLILVPYGAEGQFFQMLFQIFTIGNISNILTTQELENLFNTSVLNTKRRVYHSIKWHAYEKATVQAAQFFFTINMFQGWQFLDIFVKINSITDEYAQDCRLFIMNALKEVYYISINSIKKINRVERETDDPIFDFERQQLIDYINRAFDNDLVPAQFFKMIFSSQFIKAVFKNLVEFIALIGERHDYLFERKTRTEILNEAFELIYIRLQAISMDEIIQMIAGSKISAETPYSNLATLFDIGLRTEHVRIMLRYFREDRPILKHIRYTMLSVICLAQKSWTWNRDQQTFVATIDTLVKFMSSDDPYLRLVVMRCAYNLFYEIFESPFHPWREGRASVFVILFRLFKVILNAVCDPEREIAREAGVYIRKMFMETCDSIADESEDINGPSMFPYTQDGTLSMGSTIVQCLLGEYFKYITSISDDGKATKYPGIDEEISSLFTFNEIIFFEFLIASVNSLDMIFEITQENILLLSRHVFNIRNDSIQNTSIQFIKQPMHRNEIKRRFAILMTDEEEEMVERVLRIFEENYEENGLGESFPYLRPTP